MTKADILKLKAPLALLPYDTMNDLEVEAALKALGTMSVNRPIPRVQLKVTAVNNGLFAGMWSKRKTSDICSMVLELFSDNDYLIYDLTKPGPVGILAALEAEGTLTVIQKEEFLALSTRILTKGEEIVGEGKTVTHLDIARARRS